MIIIPEKTIKIYGKDKGLRFLSLISFIFLLTIINFVIILNGEHFGDSGIVAFVLLIFISLSFLLAVFQVLVFIIKLFLPVIYLNNKKLIVRKSLLSIKKAKTKDIELISIEEQRLTVIHKVWTITSFIFTIFAIFLPLALLSGGKGLSGVAFQKLGRSFTNLIKAETIAYLIFHTKNKEIKILANKLNSNYQELFDLNEAHQD